MLLNLAGNAIAYTPPGGHVRLSAIQAEATVVLRVQDDGIGMASEHLEKIFHRFYRVDASRHRDEQDSSVGYGLGLPLCKWIATVHGASLTAESTPGQGSVFTAVFPAPSQPKS